MSSLSHQIVSIHPHTSYVQVGYPEIYVADFSERTKTLPHKRSVEITDYNQMTPDGSALMDSAVFHNESNLLLDFSLLHDNQYTSTIVSDNEHCEGCFYNSNDAAREWVVFFELKDCLPSNVANHKRKAKHQITNVVDDFRGHSLLHGMKLYGIISCPRQKISFNNTIVGDMIAARKLKRDTGITFYGTNEVFLADEHRIRPVI